MEEYSLKCTQNKDLLPTWLCDMVVLDILSANSNPFFNII